MSTYREIGHRLDPVVWARNVLGVTPRPWQEQFLRVRHGQDVLVLTARQVGKSTAAAMAMAHTTVFKPGSLSVVACPAQRQSAELLRKIRGCLHTADVKLTSDNVYALELSNGSRVMALPGSEDSIRGFTVDGWIVVDEAALVDEELIAALRPMRAQRPEARFVMLSTAHTRTDPFWSAWERGDQSWRRIQVTVDVDPTLYSEEYLARERRALGEERYKREFLGIPSGGMVSPFTWELYECAIKPLHPDVWHIFKPTVIVHDVGCSKDRSTAVVGGHTILAPGLCLLKQFEELPQGLIGSRRADQLAAVDHFYGSKNLIFVDLTFDPTYAEILLERFGAERVIGLKIASTGDGMDFDYLQLKNGTIRVYAVGRSYLFDLLRRELQEQKIRMLNSTASRRAYEQLTMLEMEYRQSGAIYSCLSGRHDDLAISCAIAVWGLQHPHLPYWCRALEPRPKRARQEAPDPRGWT